MYGPFIFYHKIDLPPPDAKIRGGYTPPKRFAKQMAFLKKQGFVFYTVSDMIDSYLKHGRFPSRGIAITFDDGWNDNYENAFPVLRQLNIKATVFLISSCIGQISNKAQSVGEGPRAHLSKLEIREMQEYGIEFGSHTLSHKLLDRISPEEVKIEVEQSKKQLEDILKAPCNVFAYPGGHYDEVARRLVKDAGYRVAFTTRYGPVDHFDPFALNRTEILRRDRFVYQFARKVRPLVQV